MPHEETLKGYAIYTDDPNGGDPIETLYDITCSLSAGTPDVWYLPNGDPGYPGDPPEFEILKVVRCSDNKEIQDKDWDSIGLTDAVQDDIFERVDRQACDNAVDDDPPDPRED